VYGGEKGDGWHCGGTDLDDDAWQGSSDVPKTVAE
jgi:hypothetical protein